MFISRSFQIKDNRDTKKIKHTIKLNEKIIKRLCTIQIIQNDETYYLYVKAIPEQDEKIYQKKTENYLSNFNLHYDNKNTPVKWLSEPYLTWTLKHLEKYDFWKYWKKIDDLHTLNSICEKYLSDFKIILEEEAKKYFPDFTQFVHGNTNNDCYVAFEIKKEVEHYISFKGYDHEFNELKIDKNHNGQKVIIRCEYLESKESLLISDNEKNLNIEQLKLLIKSISEKIEKQFHDYKDAKNAIDESIIKFRKRLELLYEKLETEDVLIKGKCSGCS